MSDPSTVEAWMSLTSSYERVAQKFVDDRKDAAQSYLNSGLACEMALKGLIFSLERPNDWEACARSMRTHDLRELAERAGLLKIRSPLTPSLMVVTSWGVSQRYDPKPMPRKVARQMFEASFGENGVVTWIREQLRSSI